MVDFKKIIERIKKCTGTTQKEIASDIFGISDKNLSNKIRRNSVDLGPLLVWAGNENVDLNWLLTGDGDPHINRAPCEDGVVVSATRDAPISTSNVIELQHMDLVKKFKDKPRAKNANDDLLQIEELDRDTFIEVVGYIRGVATSLKIKKSSSVSGGAPVEDARTKKRANGKE
jgi:hypothetical protein